MFLARGMAWAKAHGQEERSKNHFKLSHRIRSQKLIRTRGTRRAYGGRQGQTKPGLRYSTGVKQTCVGRIGGLARW